MLATFVLGSLLLPPALLPQSPATPPPQKLASHFLRRAPQPQYAGTYVPGVGLTSPGQSTRAASSGPTLLYNNAQLSNYYSFPGPRQEWIDEGSLLPRHLDGREQILSARLTYCTRNFDPNGINAVFQVYDQSKACAGPDVWPGSDCSYRLFGLPSSPNGNDACYTIDLDLRGFECNLTTPAAPGKFGWSMTWSHPDTGMYTSWGGTGNSDSFVWYDLDRGGRNAAYRGCYWFGGKPRAGFALELAGGPAETFAVHATDPGTADSLILSADSTLQAGEITRLQLSDRVSKEPRDGLLWISRSRVEQSLLATSLALDAHMLASFGQRLTPPNTIPSQGGVFRLTPSQLPPGVYYTQAAELDAGGNAIAFSHALEHRVH